LLYRFLRLWLTLGYRLYFKKVYVRGLNHIDPQRPIIFALNHPTAFIEPTLFGTKLPFSVHFLTRGDVFVKSFKWFFDASNQVPVFRFKDGFSKLRGNRDSFELCHEKLLDDQKLLIFCEGGMKWEKRLRKVQPGAAKLALGTLEKNPDLPLVIHPVGINYDHPAKFQSDVMIEIKEAIEIREYFNRYRSDTRGAIRLLTAELEKNLSGAVIHIENEEDKELVESLWELIKSLSPESPFVALKTFTDKLNILDPVDREKLDDSSKSYTDSLNKWRMNDREFVLASDLKWWSWLYVLPLGLVGLIFKIFNAPPFLLADYISRKSISIVEFVMSIKVVAGFFLYPIYLFFLIFIASYFTTYGWFALLLMPGGLLWTGIREKWRSAMKRIALGEKRLRKMKEDRNKLIPLIQKVMG